MSDGALPIALQGLGLAAGADLIARRAQASAPRSGLSICSSPRLSHYSNRVIATAGTWDLYRIRLRNELPEPIMGLVFAFSNHMVAGSLREGATANSITVAGAVQAYGTNANDESPSRVPVTFSGAMSAVVPPKGTVLSDVVPLAVMPGEDYWLRCGVSVPVDAGVYPASGCTLGGTALYGTNNGEGSALSQSTAAKLYEGGGTIGVGPLLLIYGPEAVYGVTASGRLYPSLQVVGDSITIGYADPGDNDGSFAALNRGGWAQRALAALGVPYSIGALSGESGYSLTSGYAVPYARLCRDQVGVHATHVIAAYGRNDINLRYSVPETAEQILAFMQAGALRLVKQVCGRGRHLAVTTVLPTPGSNTGYTTAAGAIPISASRADEAARRLYNAWLRDASAAGFLAQAQALITGWASTAQVRVIDICAPIETNQAGALAQDGGCFLVPPVATIYESGTATGGTTSRLIDSTKTWTPNAYRGRVVWIHAGTGQYSNAVVQYNDATTLYCIAPFSGSATPNNTSEYRIVDTPTADATHPAPWGNAIIAAGVEDAIEAFLAL
jgi:lysophospholipase L1-like esterase